MEGTKKYRCMGLMSGTSLDGLDLVYCEFVNEEGTWSFHMIDAMTHPYPSAWRELLENSYTMDAAPLAELDHRYGRYLGEICNGFMAANGADPLFIASHGHTVFHRPAQGFSLQIGNGHDIAAVTGKKVIFDFRSLDISLGGQGAPLVPAGDRLLFAEYEYCLNIGGFSNISFDNEIGERIAFDICPANIVLNTIANRQGQDFDRDGNSGRKGKIMEALLARLNAIGYYSQSAPKSLGREFLEEIFMKFIPGEESKAEDILRTLYEHIAIQSGKVLVANGNGRVLVTGGGARNTFLVERIREHCENRIVVPERDIVEYKEALIFAFLGLLRVLGKDNCLASVTGASSDCCGGIIVQP